MLRQKIDEESAEVLKAMRESILRLGLNVESCAFVEEESQPYGYCSRCSSGCADGCYSGSCNVGCQYSCTQGRQ